jgi:hypothetical protein
LDGYTIRTAEMLGRPFQLSKVTLQPTMGPRVPLYTCECEVSLSLEEVFSDLAPASAEIIMIREAEQDRKARARQVGAI